MPGNEIGDRIHNFFQQSNLSHSQHHLVEGNWPALNNNVCAGDERQINRAFNSKNSSTQDSDIERGQGNQFLQAPYGLSFAQLNLRPEFGKFQSQNQQSALNGFMHAPTGAPARQTEENLLGVDDQPDRHNLTSREFSVFETQQRDGHQHSSTSSVSVGTAGSPINFELFGSQQQMSGQQPGMLQSMPSQQSGISDAQLLQQQVMLKQMQELQRQQQLHQLGALQRNSLNQIPSLPNQVAGNHSPALVNSSPMHDTSNHPWSSQLTMGNTNWLPRGVTQSVQGYSNGLVIMPEQGQAMRLMSLAPQQVSHSFYGVPVSNARAMSPFRHSQLDKSGMHQLPVHSTFSGAQHASFPVQVNTMDGIVAARSASEGKNYLQHAAGEDPGHVVNMQNANQVQDRNSPSTELGGKKDLAGSSESSIPEKSIKLAASSQATVALDPTEEKILFGSDDNIWEAFGGSLAADTDNCLDGTFPAVQSGSWSALMQSAVAESSSVDLGDQGQWRGLGVQSSGSLTGSQQFPVLPESGKQPAWSDGRSNVHSSSKFHQSVLNHTRESLQTGSGQQSSEEGSKWQDHTHLKIPGEGSQVSQNVYPSAELKASTVPGSWSHQQSISSHGSQPFNRPNNLWTDNLSRAVNVNRDQPAVLLRSDSMPNLNAESSQVNLKDAGAPHISSNARVGPECVQKPSDNHGFDFWRSVSSVKSGVDGSGKYPQGPQDGSGKYSQGPQILESSMNSSDKLELHDAGNDDRRENYSDSQVSNLPHHVSAGGLRESIWLDVGDSRKTSGDKSISSDPHGWKTAIPRKFQYHPMGDVNMDREQSYGLKHTVQYQAMSQHVNRPLQSSQNMLELLQKVDQSKEQNTPLHYSSNDCSGLAVLPEAKASDGTFGFSQKQTSGSQGFGLQLAPPSQVTQALNFVVVSQSPSQAVGSPSPRQEREERNHAWLAPAASVHSSPKHIGQSGESRNTRPAIFGQPNVDASQCNIIGNTAAPFVTGSHYLGSLPKKQHLAVAGSKLINPQHSNTSFDSSSTQGKQTDDYHDQSQTNDSAQITSASAANTSPIFLSQRETAQLPTMDRSGSKVSAVSQHVPGIIQRSNFPGLPDVWNSVSTLQDASGSQCHLNLLKSVEPNDVRGFCPPQKQDDQLFLRKGNMMDSGDVSAIEKQHHGEVNTTQNIQGKETLVPRLSNASPSNSATQKDIEAFGRNLKPNNLRDDYSLLHQVHTMKSMAMDPSNRDMKRFKGLDTGSDSAGKTDQQLFGTMTSVEKNASFSHTSVSSGDANILGFSPEASNARDRNISFPLQHGNAVPQDLFSSVQNASQTYSGSNLYGKTEPPQVNPRMTSTLFDQYGTLKAPLLAMHDVRRAQNVSNAEQQFITGQSLKSLVTDNSVEQANATVSTGQITNVWRAATTCIQNQLLPSHQALETGVLSQPVVASTPKKRKIATDVLLPWHKKVSLGFEKLQDISSAEADWARAMNRLIEKVEDEADVNDDVSHVVRMQRRLVLTTQLMQQLFRPPQTAILSLDASFNYDIVAYVIARSALGDACSQLCYLESRSPEQLDKGILSSEKLRTSGRISDQYSAKLVEDLVNRSRKLECELLRLDKRASILDLRLECQDLERFTVINRFAKFHSRGQVDGAGSSSASISTATGQRHHPQRYVTALPLPRNLPDRVQCLSL